MQNPFQPTSFSPFVTLNPAPPVAVKDAQYSFAPLTTSIRNTSNLPPNSPQAARPIAQPTNTKDLSECQFHREMAMVNHEAKEHVINGVPCDVVCDHYDIRHSQARLYLELHAIGGVIQQRVLNGDRCDHVYEEHNIKHPDAQFMLQMLAVEGMARTRVMNGLPVGLVSRQHAITDPTAIRKLATISQP
ncbi:hypothetical protein [Burkholderia lata]|uniref:hypothetical protein n=1 Tax=Burkholderia lata (strain ATCC 17760 / DSM 23089 / LMG 22485 / NCIMB 9086 / R18194 / 383) TaxID=482957 RepID=UPI00399BA808